MTPGRMATVAISTMGSSIQETSSPLVSAGGRHSPRPMTLESFLTTWGMSMDGNLNEMAVDWQVVR